MSITAAMDCEMPSYIRNVTVYVNSVYICVVCVCVCMRMCICLRKYVIVCVSVRACMCTHVPVAKVNLCHTSVSDKSGIDS